MLKSFKQALLLALSIFYLISLCNSLTICTLRNCDGLVFQNRTRYLQKPIKKFGYDIQVDLSKWKDSDAVHIVADTRGGHSLLGPNGGAQFAHIHYGSLFAVDKPQDGYDKFNFIAESDDSYPEVRGLIVNGIEYCRNAKELGPIDYSDFECAECGDRISPVGQRIFGGTEFGAGKWPWHAAVYSKKTSTDGLSYKCGGTLISENMVLTASHCFVEAQSRYIPKDRVKVKLGLHYRNKPDQSVVQDFNAQEIFMHEDFETRTLRDDIALIKLDRPAVITNYVRTACLWPKTDGHIGKVIGRNGHVVGWGLNEKDELSDVLLEAEMPVVSLLDCLKSNRDFFGIFLSDRNYCAGYRNGTSACNGDSGGGMFFERNGRFFIRGIVSLGPPRNGTKFCDPNQYILFIDIVPYFEWIEEKMKL